MVRPLRFRAETSNFGYTVVNRSFNIPIVKSLIQGALAVLLVLLAVLGLLAVDGLLLIPGLIFAYTVTGIGWHWQGIIPDPVLPPGPWLSMGIGLIATLVPALADGLILHYLLPSKNSS